MSYSRWAACAAILIHHVFYVPCAFSMGGGKLRQYIPTNQWAAEHPKIVVALGWIQQPLILRHYTKQFNTFFKSQIQSIDPRIDIEIIPTARGTEVVHALLDPNTIGLIFISHTYKSDVGSVAIAADGNPLPTKLFSAATPALRFAAFLGCHGPGFLQQYQIDTEFKQLPGSPIFFYSEDDLLNVNYLHGDTIKKLEKQILTVLKRLTPKQLSGGVQPDHTEDGTLSIEVKDVTPAVEPRYIYVNDHIVGTLGSDAILKDDPKYDLKDSNPDTEYKILKYTVPARAFITQKTHYKVAIRSADVSPVFFVDNYLIRAAILETPQKILAHTYAPAWRIGDAILKPIPYPLQLTGTSEQNQETLTTYLKKFGSHFDTENKENAQKAYANFLNQQWRKTERIDTDPTHWTDSIYKGRAFFDGEF